MLLWFRNDLRLSDNPALNYAIENGVTDAIFFVSKEQWKVYGHSDIKIDFVCRHAQMLKHQLLKLGIKLQLISAENIAEQQKYVLEHFINKVIIVNRELELNEVKRDLALESSGVKLVTFESDVIVPKGSVLNNAGDMFKVFTPFKKSWLRQVRENNHLVMPHTSLSITAFTDESDNGASCSAKWPLAHQFESNVLSRFFNEKLLDYMNSRDIPSIKGTSGLSPYLAIGAISPRVLLSRLLHLHPDILLQDPPQAFAWLNELIWRDFYRHLLFHYPNLIKGHNFSRKYDVLKWPNRQEYIDAWKQGKTGYPIVDAAMRQLNQTGWMHNRLRMIVASFLTKHLLVDWRIGEQYFTEQLIDFDFAANNGGWQWSAGTGCDAQPYFRVFNPMTQSKKFDPTGAFIRKYLPELSEIPDKHIHFPHEFLQANNMASYWPPIVEHKAAREQALAFYKGYLSPI